METRRLHQQLDYLHQQWEVVTQKIQKLESHKLLETRVEESMRIEALVAECLQEQQRIEQELHELSPS